MKYLSTYTPKLTVTRTQRRCVINEIAELITLYERTVTVEITLPSIWQGLKDKALGLFAGLMFPGLYVAG